MKTYYHIYDNKKDRILFTARNSNSKETLYLIWIESLKEYQNKLSDKQIDMIIKNNDIEFIEYYFNKTINLELIETEFLIDTFADKV